MKKSAGVLLTSLVLLFTNVNALGADLKSTKEQLGDVKSSINEKRELIENIEKEKDSIESQIDSLDIKMNSTSKELDNIRKDLSDTDEAIGYLTKGVKESQERLENQKRMMNSRINALYRSGVTSYLSILLDSKNMSELLDRAIYVKRIIDYDKSLVSQILLESEAIKAKKSELDERKTNLVDIKQKSDSKYVELKDQSAEKSTLIQQLEKDKAKYEKQIAQEEADARILQDKIKKLESQFKATNTKSASVTGIKYRISSSFGWRVHPVLGYKRLHAGIDIAVPVGTPVYSLRDGVVIYSGVMRGYGNVVMINHGDITSLYAHNSSIAVKEGQIVKGGQLVCYSGNSGLSSGPHLHFEVRDKSGTAIDPISYYK